MYRYMSSAFKESARVNIVFYRGNLKIRGHVFGKQSHPQDAVILSHGFMANERMCFKYAKLLAEMGFLAVTFDFCGGGIISRSDGRSQDMTIFTEKADLMAVIEGVKKQFSPAGITLLGCSQGGFVSGLVAADLGEKVIDRLILFYPAVCIPDDARKGKMMFFRFDPDDIPAVLGRFPMKLGGDYARTVIGMNPYEVLNGYAGPVLMIHGTSDKIVNILYARQLKEIYPDCTCDILPGLKSEAS